MYYGAIEAGGTKIVCAAGTEQGEIIDSIQVSTKSPKETMPDILTFFEKYKPETIGIGTFGPVELHRDSVNYGCVLNSPKSLWEGFNFYTYFRGKLGCDVVIDTDVNAAVFGEYKKGALQDVKNGMYVTIGTGIGAGIVAEGRLLHGMMHPEAGHILIGRHPEDNVDCGCKFHRNCFEGLAAGPMLLKRTGIKGEDLPEDHPVWELESYYIAQALVNYTLVLATERIVLGGGVMQRESLFKRIRQQYRELMGEYVDTLEMCDLEEYIVPAGLNGKQGIIGALYLGMEGEKA